MDLKEKLNFTFTVILTVCALIITILVIKQQFFQSSDPKNVYLEDWDKFELAGWNSGKENAPVQIIEFFDYKCSFCKNVNFTLESLKSDYGDSIAIIYQHFPLNDNSVATQAAIAVECARNQNKFVDFHNTLFDFQYLLDTLPFDSLAGIANVPDLETFKKCVDNGETLHIVKSTKELGNSINLSSVPTFLINGKLVRGAIDKEDFVKLINEELGK